jgi:hypothetical protein
LSRWLGSAITAGKKDREFITNGERSLFFVVAEDGGTDGKRKLIFAQTLAKTWQGAGAFSIGVSGKVSYRLGGGCMNSREWSEKIKTREHAVVYESDIIADLATLEAESEGRRKALVEVGEERKREWLRAETAEGRVREIQAEWNAWVATNSEWIEEALAALRGIANADYRKWEDDLDNLSSFHDWAQSVARHAVATVPALTDPAPARASCAKCGASIPWNLCVECSPAPDGGLQAEIEEWLSVGFCTSEYMGAGGPREAAAIDGYGMAQEEIGAILHRRAALHQSAQGQGETP